MEENKKKITRERNSKGQFVKCNGIGEKTRFKEGNDSSLKYKDEYCDKLIAFFDRPYTKTEYKENYNSSGKLVSKEPIILPNDYPTFKGFARTIGVTYQTLVEWKEKYPRFLAAYTRAKDMQEDILRVNSMTGLYNSKFSIFEATNFHDLQVKQEVKTNVSGNVDIGVDEKTLALIERVGKRLNNGDEKDGKNDN